MNLISLRILLHSSEILAVPTSHFHPLRSTSGQKNSSIVSARLQVKPCRSMKHLKALHQIGIILKFQFSSNRWLPQNGCFLFIFATNKTDKLGWSLHIFSIISKETCWSFQSEFQSEAKFTKGWCADKLQQFIHQCARKQILAKKERCQSATATNSLLISSSSSKALTTATLISNSKFSWCMLWSLREQTNQV